MLYTPITIEQWIEEHKELLVTLRQNAASARDSNLAHYAMGRRDMLSETITDLEIILKGSVEIPEKD